MNQGQLQIGTEVWEALQASAPVVALETAVVTHGLPHPVNVEAAALMERAVRESGAIPASCLVFAGALHVGASEDMVRAAAVHQTRQKAGVRDLATAIASGNPAGLTVSATLHAASMAGVDVFATGGIGGVHFPAQSGDVSADLLQLSRCSLVTVCSGAKSVLDIPRTVEWLETLSVAVYGYRTQDFPAFYLSSSGISVQNCNSAHEIARIFSIHRDLNVRGSIVIGNPVPSEHAVPPDEWKTWLTDARSSAERNRIQGKDLTPYLLSEVASASGGRTVEANLALLESNAQLAGEIAVSMRS